MPALLFLFIVLFRLIVGSWLVMLMAGALHVDVEPSFPHWTYTQSIIVSAALTLLGSYFYTPTETD
jgi:hypothetical protein